MLFKVVKVTLLKCNGLTELAGVTLDIAQG